MGFNHYSLLLLALVLLFALAAGYLFRLVILALLKYLRSGEVRKEKAETKKTLGEALKAHRTRCKMTQEFVAETIGVSRQAVSKWESAASIPDLDKILKLSQLFDVSTDTLLKDEIDLADALPGELPPPSEAPEEAPLPVRTLTLEMVHDYLATVRVQAGRLALGVALCILSPTVLILLGGLSDYEGGYRIPENLAGGTAILLLIIAGAVALFLSYGRRMEPYEAWEHEPVELAYGVTGMVEKEKAQYEGQHTRLLILGVGLCILAAVPLFVAAAVVEDGMLLIAAVDLLLLLVAAGVFLLVKTCTLFGAFQLLLEEGDYRRGRKLEDQRNEAVSTIYWCAVTAVYLAWSFLSGDWHITWVVWPVAGVFWGVIAGILSLVRRSRSKS